LRRKILFGALIFTMLVVISAAYVGIRVRNELIATRSLLTESPTTLTGSSIARADEHLEAAVAELNSPPAKFLRLLPITRQNVVALETVARDTRPVLESAHVLEEVVGNIESQGLMVNGRVDIGLLQRLENPLSEQIARLSALERSAEQHRSGWLLPPLWDEIDDLLYRAQELRTSASEAHGLVEVAGSLLGGEGKRSYLIVLLNNAELRGAGGIPSGLGTISIFKGDLRLGEFYYAPELAGPRPYARVQAPPDFKRRYGRFWADRTFWVNTTMSSDVPDVAEVAARLFRTIPGRQVDGVLFADPHGVAALMDSDASIEIPGSKQAIGRAELPDYAYSGVYEQEAAGVVGDRHDALLNLGELAFQEILSGNLGRREQLSSMSQAFAGGHLRFVSFDPREQSALDAADASGNLEPPAEDSLFVTAYNTGANKLDYWGRRSVDHHCIVESAKAAQCTTQVTVRNIAPDGLPPVVAGRPYGLLTSFLEVYVPEHADLAFVERNGRGTGYFEDRQDGHATIGFNLKLEPGEETTVEVGYDLALDGDFSLEVRPQPLTHPAPLEIAIEIPDGWEARGPEGRVEGEFRHSGTLSEPVSITAGPSEVSGLTDAWQAVVRLWHEPLG
jgi:Protein of unknown function (DUF4012)